MSADCDTLSSGKKGYQKTVEQQKHLSFQLYKKWQMLRLQVQSRLRPRREPWLGL